jgi:hypothetical protein
MLKKLLVVFAVAACALSANAAEIDTRNLSDAQVAELRAIAAKAVSENEKAKTTATNPSEVLSTAAGWGRQASEAAAGFGKAFTVAAKELGITVNEFLATDAGKLTAGLIIWKVMGASIVKMLFGIFFVGTGLGLARVLYKRLFTKEYKSVEYSYFGGLFKGTKLVRVPKSISELRNDGEWLTLWIIIILVVLTIAIGGGVFFTF